MAFRVHFSGQAQPQDFGDDDGFEFLDGGVLAIHFGDEETWAQFHPPTKWERVSADPSHVAGMNTPYVEDGDLEDDAADADEDHEADDHDEDDYEEDDYADQDFSDEGYAADGYAAGED